MATNFLFLGFTTPSHMASAEAPVVSPLGGLCPALGLLDPHSPSVLVIIYSFALVLIPCLSLIISLVIRNVKPNGTPETHWDETASNSPSLAHEDKVPVTQSSRGEVQENMANGSVHPRRSSL